MSLCAKSPSVRGFLASLPVRLLFKDRGGGQNFSTSFWMRSSQAPLCRYRFKVIFDNIIFLLSGNIIEYICFWRFNSIIVTWNKWLGFTKSVIMGLNNISPWPCPLGVVCLPCVIIWLFKVACTSGPIFEKNIKRYPIFSLQIINYQIELMHK